MRIVSLLPSATDIIVALGAQAHLVGVSHSCGDRWAGLPRLTSTWLDVNAASHVIDQNVRAASRPLYELDEATLRTLAPDVIISQSLCDVCAVPSGDVRDVVPSLPGPPVLVDLTPCRLSDVPGCFEAVGAAIDHVGQAASLVAHWHAELGRHRQRFAGTDLRVAFLDWLDPPFAAGHWIPDMLTWLGVESVLARSGESSFRITWEEVEAARPDLVIAACCGFDRERVEADLNTAPVTTVALDGHALFSRPSPALLPSLELLSQTIAEHLASG